MECRVAWIDVLFTECKGPCSGITGNTRARLAKLQFSKGLRPFGFGSTGVVAAPASSKPVASSFPVTL